MTPAQQRELWDWYQARRVQQLSYPVDEATKAAIEAATDAGPGSTGLTQSIGLTGDPQSITVPRGYMGTRIIKLGGADFEIPYL